MTHTPILSVCMITYRHEKFIREAIEGVLAQKTDFPFELVISEDLGGDKTRDICIEYQKKYPNTIRLNLNETNLGPQPNEIKTIALCKGKYIAFCEGDDYWTDPLKLQKQVDFLEANPEFTMSAHAAQGTYDNKEFFDIKIDKSEFNLEDILLSEWGIMTASIVFRKAELTIPDWLIKVKNGDFAVQLLLAMKGKIGYMQDKMSVYRQHPGGISATLNPLNQAAWLTYLLDEFNKYSKAKYAKLIKQRLKLMYTTQIAFAKEYNLRKQKLILNIFNILRPLAPFLIKNLRK